MPRYWRSMDTLDDARLDGIWVRTVLEEPRGTPVNDATLVIWAQCRGLFVDVRCDSDARRAKSFAGETHSSGIRLTWARRIDFRSTAPPPDVGDMSFLPNGDMNEDAVLPGDDFREVWTRLPALRARKISGGAAVAVASSAPSDGVAAWRLQRHDGRVAFVVSADSLVCAALGRPGAVVDPTTEESLRRYFDGDGAAALAGDDMLVHAYLGLVLRADYPSDPPPVSQPPHSPATPAVPQSPAPPLSARTRLLLPARSTTGSSVESAEPARAQSDLTVLLATNPQLVGQSLIELAQLAAVAPSTWYVVDYRGGGAQERAVAAAADLMRLLCGEKGWRGTV